MSFGDRLQKSRKSKRFTQVQVAEIVGIDDTTISKYENNKSEPDNETLNKLSTLYDVSIDWLHGRVNDPKQTLSNEARDLIGIIDLPEEEAINKIKQTFSYKGKDLTDEQAKKIYYFSLGVVDADS